MVAVTHTHTLPPKSLSSAGKTPDLTVLLMTFGTFTHWNYIQLFQTIIIIIINNNNVQLLDFMLTLVDISLSHHCFTVTCSTVWLLLLRFCCLVLCFSRSTSCSTNDTKYRKTWISGFFSLSINLLINNRCVLPEPCWHLLISCFDSDFLSCDKEKLQPLTFQKLKQGEVLYVYLKNDNWLPDFLLIDWSLQL